MSESKPTYKHCCDEMTLLVELGFITIWNGEPFALLVDRLDLHEKSWFKYCPFCGTAVGVVTATDGREYPEMIEARIYVADATGRPGVRFAPEQETMIAEIEAAQSLQSDWESRMIAQGWKQGGNGLWQNGHIQLFEPVAERAQASNLTPDEAIDLANNLRD